jgi:hypothetical protein
LKRRPPITSASSLAGPEPVIGLEQVKGATTVVTATKG